jgi:hypothetical protein
LIYPFIKSNLATSNQKIVETQKNDFLEEIFPKSTKKNPPKSQKKLRVGKNISEKLIKI